jgi:hypothetical protein
MGSSSRPRMDFGRRVCVHADPAGPACSGVTFRSVLRFASGFFPTRPHGASPGVSRRRRLRAVASGSRLLPSRPAKDFHLQSSAHARHTRSGYALPSLSPRRRILILIVARFSSKLSRRSRSCTPTSVARATTIRRDDLLKHPTLDQLNALGLHGMAKAFVEIAANGQANGLGHHEWLGLLLDREAS